MANIPSFNNVIEEIDSLVEDVIVDMRKTTGKDCGLDDRCGTVWVSKDCIAIRANTKKSFEYYGGLEYVDRDEVVELPGYVIYSAEHHRISSMIMHYESEYGDLEETEEEEAEA